MGVLNACSTNVYGTYETFQKHNPLIPTHFLKDLLSLIQKEISFFFTGKTTFKRTKQHYPLPAFSWLLLKQISLNKVYRSTFIFPLWSITKEEINKFTELANSYYPTIKFTTETQIFDTCHVIRGHCWCAHSLKTDRNFQVHAHSRPHSRLLVTWLAKRKALVTPQIFSLAD